MCVLNNNMCFTMCFSEVSEIYNRLLLATCTYVFNKVMCLDMCFSDVYELCSHISLILSFFALNCRYVLIYAFRGSGWIFFTSNSVFATITYDVGNVRTAIDNHKLTRRVCVCCTRICVLLCVSPKYLNYTVGFYLQHAYMCWTRICV